MRKHAFPLSKMGRTLNLDQGREPGIVTAENNTAENEEKEQTKRATNTVPYYKLFTFADSFDYSLMFIGTVAAVGSGICTPLMTILFGDLVHVMAGSINIKDSVHEACKVALKLVYLALGSGFASFLQTSCWMITGERQAARIRGLYLHAILRQDVAFFDKETSTGEIVARLSGDTILIQDAMSDKVGNFIQLLITFIGGFIVAFVKGWLLTVALISTIPPIVISGAITMLLLRKFESQAQSAYSAASTVVEQTIGSIRTVASFSGEKRAIKEYDKALIKAYRSGVYEGLATGLGFGTLMLIVFCSYGFAMWMGGKMIIEKGYTGGTVISVIFAVFLGSLSLGQTSPSLSAFAAGQAAAFKMFEVINRKPRIDASDPKGRKFKRISGNIELRDIYFSYPTRPNERIFTGLSLFIPSGSTAALVGPSGSGKSSVINLIERFYDPQGGEVLIGGINLKEFQLKWIRERIGLVSQEPVLFSTSIKDNIAFGKDSATIEEIEAAAELSNAASFISKLPQGLDTMVGEHGIQLSGGQKQRIAIARAILKDPKILLLDEATSALDVESERIVQEALDQVMVNRTTMVVAHRLSTIKRADSICVLHQGKIVEKGKHSELLNNPNGVYSNLIQLQDIRTARKLSVKDLEHNRVSFWIPIGMSPMVSASERTPLKEPQKTPGSAALTQKKQTNLSLTRLAYLNTPEIPALLLGTVAAAANGVIYPIFGLILASIINTFYLPAHELRKGTESWALKFVILGLGSLVSTPSMSYFFAIAGCKLIKRMRSMCFEKVVYMEISWFDETENSSGSIGARLSGDATSVRYLVGDTLALLVQNISTAVAGLLIGFETNWELALIILLLIPLLGLGGYVQVKSMKGFGADAKKMYEEASQVASDAVGSIRTVASFCAEERTVQLYQKKCEGPLSARIRQGLISGVSFGLSFFFIYSVYAISFYSGAQLVDKGKTTFHKVFRVFFALSMTALGISQSNTLAPDAGKARSSATSVLQILGQKSKIDASGIFGIKLENVKGDIKFQHVGFKYPTRPDIEVLRDFCLSINSGQTVALVGESGSGKSTVIALLQRYYDPDSGRITLDGVELRKLNLKWLRQQIGIVNQEPVLFNATVRENIAYGKDGTATEAEIVAAAKLANAHNFISGLQQGYDTVVGERGIQLSGGQKQRVAIARAIVKSPRVLLLDEATSALDAESEQVVQAALEKAMVNRTTIVVAHRLSTIKNAEVIAVVKNGSIAEKGKHETLLSIRNGIYASLVGPRRAASRS